MENNFAIYQPVGGQFSATIQVRCIKRTTVLSEEMDAWCGQVADELGRKFGYGQFGKSTVINNAVEFYHDFFDVHQQLLSNKDEINRLFTLPEPKQQLALDLVKTI